MIFKIRVSDQMSLAKPSECELEQPSRLCPIGCDIQGFKKHMISIYRGRERNMVQYELFTPKGIVFYLIIVNIIGFLAMMIDKFKAEKGYWRIPEKTLFIITLLGGGIGTITGMYLFRHKTKKKYFTIGFPVILFSEIFIVIYLMIKIKLIG